MTIHWKHSRGLLAIGSCRITRLLGLSLTLIVGGCLAEGSRSDDVEGVADKESTITHGLLVPNNTAPFDSVVALGGCSGVKIGARRFLTAGHCDGVVSAGAGFNGRLSLTNSLDQSGSVMLSVDRIYHHPTFLQPVDFIFDALVVDVLNDTPGIPTVPLDVDAFPDGSRGLFTGYGCDNDDNSHAAKKQFGASLALSSAQYTAIGGLSNTFTHFVAFSGGVDGIQLCPGDSGGPLFRFSNGAWRVAGINSFIRGGERW